MMDEHNDPDDPLAWWGGARTEHMSLDCTLTAALAPEATIGTVAVLRFNRLPDLLCHLTHEDFLTLFVPGLGSACSPETRPFLTCNPRVGWEAHLGAGSRLSTSAEEAQELCQLVDEVAPLYQARLAEVTTRLGLWGYPPTTTAYGKQAARLCTVPVWLWQATMQFCDAHGFADGDSPWHRFLVLGDEVQVWHEEAHAAQVSLSGRPIFPLLGQEVEVEVLYRLPDLKDLAYRPQAAWADAIGEASAWTAPYAAEWFVETLLPQVLTHHAYHVADVAAPVGGWKGLLQALLPLCFR